MDYRELPNSADALTRSAVGYFLYEKRALLKYRKIYVLQVRLYHIQGIISHTRDKQLAVGLSTWRCTFELSLEISRQNPSQCDQPELNGFVLLNRCMHLRNNTTAHSPHKKSARECMQAGVII